VHTTVVSLGKAWRVFPYGKRDTEVSKALLPLQYSLGYVLMTSMTVARHWAVVLPPKVVSGTNSLLDDLQAAATEDGGIVWHPRKPKS
jgi:hypothetical protein